MDLADSGDEGRLDTPRRGLGRKRLHQMTVGEHQEMVNLQVLKQRKKLVVLDEASDEQSKRISNLVRLLRTGSPPPMKRRAPSYYEGSPSKLIKHHLDLTTKTAQASWLMSEVDRVEGKNPKPYWVSQYISNLPEVFVEPFNYENVPKQVFTHAVDSTIATAAEVLRINRVVTELGIAFSSWCKMIKLTRMRKMQLLRLRIAAREKHRMEPNTLDEGCIWGLKPLRGQLGAPYFKTADGLSAAPPHPNVGNSKFSYVTYDLCGKQNWLGKDIAALKDCIRDALIEAQLFQVREKTGLLLKDCVQVKEKELHARQMKCMVQDIDEEAAGGTGKRRGRPRKYGRQSVFATIMPTLFTLPEGGHVRYHANNADIQEWRDKKQDDIRKLKYSALVEEFKDEINWDTISKKVTAKTKKVRSAMDCYLAFKHEADPNVNCKRWSQEETRKLQAFVEEFGIDEIEGITSTLGTNRSVFQCFQKWKNTNVKTSAMRWDSAKDMELNTLVYNIGGNWNKVAFQFNDDLATRNRVMDRFKKNTNPVLKAGQISRVEDALLILTIEKLKPHFAIEGHFGELVAYLPWRFETVWRDRAGNLFANFIVPWTIQEDEQLLKLARTMNRNWRQISDTFKSFKNRKGCLTRWKILQKRLKHVGSLKAYHESYSTTRYNVLQYKHLNDILNMLKRALDLPTVTKVQISAMRPPTDEELGALLLAFDRNIMKSAIKGLEGYIQQRDDNWDDVIRKVNENRTTIDRRSFHRGVPQSMASALRIRELKLLPRNEITFTLTEYQEDVYKYYARFTYTSKSLKKKRKRRYIPSARELIQMLEVKDILKPRERDDRESGESEEGL